MINQKQLRQNCIELFERQCAAHSLDPNDAMLRGVFANLMQYMLGEWELAEREMSKLAPGPHAFMDGW